MLVGLAVMDVNDADQIAAADQRNRKKGLVGVFRERVEAFETGVGRGVFAKRHHGIMHGHPARNSFAHFQANIADFRTMRQLRGAENDFIRGVFHKVNQAGIRVRHLHDEIHELTEHGF